MLFGCYAQIAKEKLKEIKEIDLILGVNEKKDIVSHIENMQETLIEISDISKQEEFAEFGDITYTEKTRAVIKVQDGCNQFCSYCIIPYARGRIRSRNPENVISEIKKIAQKGIKEVVLTGIHLASYGKDLENGFYLIDLLEKLQEIEGIERIRLGSLEPTLITQEFVKRLSKLPKICDQFHLSLQSGCNDTLKRMNRKYTIEEFEKSVEILRTYYKNVHLTTDIIVGFPAETEEEFEKTYAFLEKIKFYKIHVFKYSPRSGTVAAKMQNQIEGTIKERRSSKLIKLSENQEENYQKEYIGKSVDVLLEEREGEYIKGHTTNYMVVKIKEKTNLENTIQTVKIIQTQNLELIGEIQNK